MFDLAILGLLDETDLHGYELRKRLGDLLGSAERLPEALDAFGRARSLEPRNLAVSMKAAVAASCLGRFRDARNLSGGLQAWRAAGY